ncbi:hypothetical protein K502DRAFT_348885 [Neoconidiobolus thromboides FSU 785]|nr:hypothetical protein K502DRAFT_348885 [Neoconidiobolus thromboides FSU 785]
MPRNIIKNELGKYKNYQEKFIRENRLLLKYSNIDSDTIKHLNYSSNIVSIDHLEMPNIDDDRDSNNNDDIETTINFPKLKRIAINCSNYKQVLKQFSDYLNQLKELKIIGFEMIIEEIITYLTPGILKALKIYI